MAIAAMTLPRPALRSSSYPATTNKIRSSHTFGNAQFQTGRRGSVSSTYTGRTTTHHRFEERVRGEMGISQGLLRLSAGLEDTDDLIADLSYALDQA